MGKFHRSRARKLSLKKKLSDKRRLARREKGKAASQPKFKDPGVPFKGKIPPPDEQRKKRAEEIKNIQKRERSKLHLQNRGLTDIISDAEKRDDEFSLKSTAQLADEDKHKVNQVFKSCYKEFKKVVEAADVILEVLDARDPLGSRCPQVEQAVLSSGSNKRLVLVLNKIDLIPRDNLEKWLKYLRLELPTVAFKASTQSQKDNLSQSKVAAIHMSENLQSSRQCVGANFLMKVLGNYCRSQNILTSIRVGVVGFPNVGKSSIINSLKRCHTCVVGGTPGVTKNMQEVILDKHIRLLDSPGVVFAKDGTKASLALRNAVKIEKLDDVLTPAEAIIQRANHQQLIDHYKIPEFSSSNEFLFHVAKRIGRFRKGGVPDVDSAARKLLNDWNSGVIKFYTHPPEVYQPSTHISAELVVEMGKAFDISALEEQMELEKLPEDVGTESTVIKSESLTEGNTDTDNLEMDIEKSSEFDMAINIELKKPVKECDKSEQFVPPEFRQNKLKKKAYKKMRKMRKKNEKRAVALSKTMDGWSLTNDGAPKMTDD